MIAWPPHDSDARRAIAVPAAVLSLGAAAIHFAVIGEHLREFLLYGVLFVLTSWFQAWWAVQYVARPSRRLEWLALVLNLGVVGVWVWSRTIGLPIAPAPGGTEVVGTADVIATIFEIALVTLLAEVIRLGAWERAGRQARLGGAVTLAIQVASLALVIVGTTIALSALANPMTMG
jgi:hypothetical protein